MDLSFREPGTRHNSVQGEQITPLIDNKAFIHNSKTNKFDIVTLCLYCIRKRLVLSYRHTDTLYTQNDRYTYVHKPTNTLYVAHAHRGRINTLASYNT